MRSPSSRSLKSTIHIPVSGGAELLPRLTPPLLKPLPAAAVLHQERRSMNSSRWRLARSVHTMQHAQGGTLPTCLWQSPMPAHGRYSGGALE